MTPLDKESMQSKIARMRRNIKELKRLGQLSYQVYAKEIEHTATAERLLQVCIEAMLDIGSHIIAEEALGEPLEYRDVFLLLSKAKILPQSKEAAFLNLAGLRNRLVHAYEDIDHRKIHAFLREQLEDFDVFMKAVVKYLKK